MRRNYQAAIDPSSFRIQFVVSGLLFLLLLIGIRLFVKSVVAHETLSVKAQQQYLVRKAVEPRRGTMYASDAEAATILGAEDERTWKPLAVNERTYALSVVPKNIKDKSGAADWLTQWTKLPREELLQKLSSDKLYLPPLRRGLSEAEKELITQEELPGVFLTEESQRYYPEESLAAQIIGFVNADGEGAYGLEAKYDEDLRGSGGEVVAERDVRGRLLTEQHFQPVRDGSHLVLTIDRNVQGHVEATLEKAIATYEADAGTIVVMDVQTGGIVAMANYPDFDPNEFNTLKTEEQGRFANPAVSAVWEPGSIFKTVVMGIGLEAGVVEPDTEGVFGSSVTVGSATIHTAENKAFGRETMTQVLENSDNVAMVWLADKIGSQRLFDGLRRFGFGQATGIDLPSEASGYLPKVTNWRDINRATISFGQGISATPLQMTSAMATIANGGKRMQPHLVQKIVGADGAIIKEFAPTITDEYVLSPQTAVKLAGMMVSVVERGHGKRAKVIGYPIAGKTGTAQIPDPKGGYEDGAHIGGFGGFFPADNPRFAMIVKLDRPKTVKFAESSAAPTFGEVAHFMLNYYRIPPTELAE